MTRPILARLTGISKAFAGVHALKGVGFDLLEGEVHALVGENGAGKSTLIRVLTGAHRPDEGTIEIGGREITDNSPVRARSLGIAAIYQQPALFPDLSVAENLAIGLELGGPLRMVHWRNRHERARQLLNRIGADIETDVEVRTLTMPEQQLVEIARALGADAKIVIMDEPTSSLSDREVDNLFRVIREMKAHGVGVIYISHRLEELPKVADRVTALRDGEVVGTRAMGEVTRAELIRMMVGRSLSSIFPKIQVEPGKPVLRLHGVGCRASGVHDISFEVHAGEIFGLAGLVGAGRTELARVLFGLTPADSGSILIRERPVTIESPSKAVAEGIAYVPEDRRRHGVVPEMTVAANTSLATLRAVSRLGILDRSRERRQASSYVKRLGIKTPSIETQVGDLSGGNQQKVALARWLAAEPSVLILDEPTQGIDVGAKAEVHKLMGELAEKGMAIIMISSELPEVLGMSDRIGVMYKGWLAGVVDGPGATQEELMELALGHTGAAIDA